MKPAIDAQSSAPSWPDEASPNGDARALALLEALRQQQKDLPRRAALAWERAVFCEAFLDPEPGRRVQAFLRGESRP